jgi:hypothetical protein
MEYVSYLASVTILWFTNFPTKITNQQIFLSQNLGVNMTSLEIYGDPGSVCINKS